MKIQRFYVPVFCLLVMIGCLACPLQQAEAKDYTENEITYSIQDGKAVVSCCTSKAQNITIPSKVNGYEVIGVGSYAFQNCQMKKIALPETIESISSGAFMNCDDLVSFRMPKRVTILESYVFYGCAKLKNVWLNEKMTQISSRAFYQCISLRSLQLPENLKNIGDGAFEKCYKLSGIRLGDKLDVIGERAFCKNYNMTSITIPEGVTVINSRAFFGCKALKKVIFEGDRTSVSERMFQKCTSLKTIRLPEEIKAIPKYFLAETGIRTFKIPEKVTVLRSHSFMKCEELVKLVMNKKLYALEDGVFRQSGLKKITFNKNMQFIGNGAFGGTNIKRVSLPDKLEYIGKRVFADCRELYEVKLPKSVRGVNPGAFNHCISLKKIKVDPGNPYYSSQDGVLYDKRKTKLLQYPLNKRNRSFQVPDSVRIIRAHAFEENRYLKELMVGAETIGFRAFSHMDCLKKVTFRKGVKKIKAYAFAENKKLRIISMADSVREIGEYAFHGAGLVSVNIPRNLKTLGRYAFYECNALTGFLGGKGANYMVKDGVLYNRKGTRLIQYPAKRNAKYFTVPDRVKKLEYAAFYHVKNLQKLYFGKNIRVLPDSCIYACPKLRSVIFNDRVQLKDGYYAIYGCKSLAAIVGPNNWILKGMAENADVAMIIV